MRKKTVVGNWKMFKTPTEATRDFREFIALTESLTEKVDCGIAAPAISLVELAQIRGKSSGLYAQNCHWALEGAFTGEIASPMLKSIGATGSVIGHSERRQYFGETNATAGQRMGTLLQSGLECILCIGETLAERERGDLKKTLRNQLIEAFSAAQMHRHDEVIGSNPARPLLTVAYEPVWAIGTGKSATPIEAQEAHAFVREMLSEILGSAAAQVIRIQYGGSVNLSNVASFMKCPDIDGALVGGASLKPKDFAELCKSCI